MHKNQIMDYKNKYSIYSADEFNNLDKSLFHSNIRWSVDNSKFIVEWVGTPLKSFLTHSEALTLMQHPDWLFEDKKLLD